MALRLAIYGGSFLLMIAMYFGINALGQAFAPKITHHEQENAHCYTAGKMFFVSIACVPKS